MDGLLEPRELIQPDSLSRYSRLHEMLSPYWEHFSHEADMGVRGVGSSPAIAFEQVAVAMTAVMLDPGDVGDDEVLTITCQAPDLELLLADWLNTLIYHMAARQMLFSRFAVQLEGTQLTAQAWGEMIDRQRHQIAVEIKGATYTELKVAQDARGNWFAQCVVDV